MIGQHKIVNLLLQNRVSSIGIYLLIIIQPKQHCHCHHGFHQYSLSCLNLHSLKRLLFYQNHLCVLLSFAWMSVECRHI